MRRRLALALIGLALAGLIVGGRLTRPRALPLAAVPLPADTVSSTAMDQEWYCALATAVRGGQADGSLVLLNSGSGTLRGTVTVYPNQGRSRRRSFLLGPLSRGTVAESAVAQGPFVAATVVFDGPGGSVEQTDSGPLGVSAGPCANAPSSQWFFATGTTRTGASLVTALFNPFPEPALADLTFADEHGVVAPAPFQGVFVPGHSLITIDVGQHVVQAADVATSVRVRVGRLVVSQLQLDAVTSQMGLAIQTGSPAPSRRWFLPDGLVDKNVSDSIQIYDPQAAPAQVTVAVKLSAGAAEPFHLVVAGRSLTVLDLSGQARVAPDDPYSVVVSSGGTPVVVARRVVSSTRGRSGYAVMAAAASPARAWLLSAGGATTSEDEWIEVFNPGRRTAMVSLSVPRQGRLEPAPGGSSLRLGPGERVSVRLGEHVELADLSLVVRADRPVVVERDLYQVGGPGISLAIGSPLR